jgi:predicted PurR-regulated permease PerM
MSGAFAFLVALSSTGLSSAIILLLIVLLTQNVLQTVMIARMMGDSLRLHPLVVLVVTMLGGIFGGLVGAALGAPLAAMFVNAGKRIAATLEPEFGQNE